jgi:hypothetical protein
MKKLPLLLSIIFLLTLTACGASSSAQPGAAPASQGGASASALPATTQLLLGTLKLDGTGQAVTADQAEELLPLWQTMSVLVNSDTAADQEKEALTTQIQETMTADQMQAIIGMNLTREDMLSLMQQQGPAMSGGSQNNNSQSGNSAGGASVPRGDRPPDEVFVPRGGGGFSGGGQNLSAEQIATAQAARQGNENFVPPVLIDAVVEYLKEKAGS